MNAPAHPRPSHWSILRFRRLEVLRRNAHPYTNNEIAALIEAATGMCFGVSVVSRRRASPGLDCTSRNGWSAPIKRWQVPRQRPH